MTVASPEQQIATSEYFDAQWYHSEYPDAVLTDMSAAAHFLRIGYKLGRNPSPDFNTKSYLERYTDVANRGDNPLLHFELHGRGEGRSPCPTCPAPSPSRFDVDIIVPVYNALEDVQACLSSLSQTPNGYTARVLVINDGSDTATTDWLRKKCVKLGTDTVEFGLIEHPENRGYTKAVNTGLKTSEAPYVVTLNSDTIVTPFWLDGLIRCMQSDPEIGITGPLSNAASWQNVPELHGADGKFAINALPEALSPAQMAEIVRNCSRRRFPRSTFVNGFCFMIKRSVLEAIGYMDEGAFPMGYGEENDFCIRAQDAGYSLAFADDTYVFHAKSKSFGSERRVKLSKSGGEALKEKHGADKFSALVSQVADTRAMDDIRRTVKQALESKTRSPETQAVANIQNQRILFILPVRGGGGGAHSVIQEVAAMRALGVTAKVAIRAKDHDDFRKKYGDISDVEGLFVPFTNDTLCYVAQSYDVVVATIFTSVKLVNQVIGRFPWILPAYYAQDYEPMFFDTSDPLWQEAFDSYTALPQGSVLFAKTHWIGSTIEKSHDAHVAKVEPSIDHSVYNLNGTSRPLGNTVNICAMIRPRTPRRGADRTMLLLSKLKEHLGDKANIHIFGCDENSPEFNALHRDFDFTNHGILTRPRVAEVLRQSHIFVDLSDYQAFGRTSLEAMACGAIAVVPQEGGGYEYAVDNVNALIVDTFNVETCFARLTQLLSTPNKIAAMQFAALETASKYCPRRAALSELMTFAPALANWRQKFPKPTRARVHLIPDNPYKSADQFPGFGNDRLPAPYCQEALLPSWEPLFKIDGTLPNPGSAEIAIIQHAPKGKSENALTVWCDAWRKNGGRLIYDLGTQNIENLPPRDIVLLEHADRVVVPTQQIHASLPTPLAKKTEVLPSFLDLSIWQPRVSSAGSDRLRIGYIGTEKNLEDLKSLKPVLEKIQTSFGLEVEVIGTYQKATPIVGQRIGYFKRRNAADLHYAEFVSWLQEAAHWDIMLIPDQTGDPLKKFLQASAMRSAIICHSSSALSEIARNEENCLIVDKKKSSWEAAIARLMEDTGLRERLVKQAQKDLREKWSVQANPERYRSLLERVWQ